MALMKRQPRSASGSRKYSASPRKNAAASRTPASGPSTGRSLRVDEAGDVLGEGGVEDSPLRAEREIEARPAQPGCILEIVDRGALVAAVPKGLLRCDSEIAVRVAAPSRHRVSVRPLDRPVQIRRTGLASPVRPILDSLVRLRAEVCSVHPHRESECFRHQKFAEESTSMIGTIDDRLLIDRIGRDVQALLGYRPAELLGRSILSFVDATNVPDMLGAFAVALRTQGPVFAPTAVRAKNGDVVQCDAVVVPLVPGTQRRVRHLSPGSRRGIGRRATPHEALVARHGDHRLVKRSRERASRSRGSWHHRVDDEGTRDRPRAAVGRSSRCHRSAECS